MITETKMCSSDVTSDYFTSRNYNIFRKDRPSSRPLSRGGGLAILVHDGIFAMEIIEDIYYNTESIAIKINYGTRILICVCMYRAPDSSVEYSNNIILTMNKVCELNFDQIIICGDFNFPEIDWINHLVDGGSTESSDNVVSRFYDACQDTFLHQHVTEFTRKRGRDEPSLLDLILTRNELEIEEIKYDSPIGKSDHLVLTFDFALEGFCELEEIDFRRRIFFRGNYNEIKTFLSNVQWYSLLLKDVQEKWDYIHEIYMDAVNSFVPWRKTYSEGTTNNRWMTRDTLKALNVKSEKWNEYRNDKTPEKYAIYARYRNDSVSMVRNAKLNFEMKLADDIEKGDFQGFYAYLRSKTSIKEGVSKVVRPDGTLSRNLKETGDTINQSFQSVFVREGDEPVPNFDFRIHGAILEDIDFSVSDVHKVICGLKESSSPGPDEIHPKFLIECVDYLDRPLYYLFRDSLDSGTIPNIWKVAHVTPIYKKGVKSDPLNYRPISLTSVVCKAMERIIRDKIIEHLDSHKLLSIHQHGFRSNRSCLTQLLE